MGNGYTRQSETGITDGQTVFAGPLEDELDAIQAAFNATTGHSHDGTAGEGPKINLATSVQGILSKTQGGTGITTDLIPIASGTNTITLTANEAFASYTSGKGSLFIASGTNTGAITINMNGLGNRKGRKFVPDVGETDLASQDIIAGGLYFAIFDPTLDTGTGGFHVHNLSGYLPRIAPTIQTSATIQQLTGSESTLNFNSILGVVRTQAYWNSVDGKFYIKVLNSSGVQVGNPIVFDGTALTIGSFSTAKAQAEAVLNHIVNYDDTTTLFSGSGTTSWVTWPLTEAFDPRGIVTVASNQFTVNSDCYIDWTAGAAITINATSQTGVKTRLYDVTDGNAIFWSTILGDATTLSGGITASRQLQGMMKGHGVLEAGHTYRIEAGYKTNTSGAEIEFISSNFRSGTSHWEDYPSLVVNLRTISPV